MNTDEKIDKILELQTIQSTDIALIKQSQNVFIKDYTTTKESHYRLRDDFKSLKSKGLLIAAFIGSTTTFLGNWIYNHLKNL